MAFDELRQEYDGAPLFKKDCAIDPRKQFQSWFDQAVQAKIEMANAMTLSTVSEQGVPRGRIVLLKELDEKGFVFFTNYESKKAKEIEGNANASLLFWWHLHARQILIEGTIYKVKDEVSDNYFNSRPRESNIAAIASAQSRLVENRGALEEALAKVEKDNQGKTLQRPTYWGGYRLIPTKFEFWQGRPDRSHDRIEYSFGEDGRWQLGRLNP